MGASDSKNTNLPFIKTNLALTTNRFKIEEFIADIADPEITDQALIDQIQLTAVKKNAIFNHREGKEGLSLLHLATKTFRYNFIQYLIEQNGFDVNITSKTNMTVLHLLVITVSEEGKSEEERNAKFNDLFEYYKKKHIKLNFQDDKGYTGLHYAVIKKNAHAANALIRSNGININLEDKRSMTPLQISAKGELDKITCTLIDYTEPDQLVKSSTANFVLHSLCKNKTEKINMIEMILKKLKGASEKRGGKNYLKAAMKATDTNQATLMHIAVEYNHSKIVDSLLKKFDGNCKASDSNGNLLIHLVAKTGSIKMFDMLISNEGLSSEPNLKLENPLHIAAFFNNKEFISKYLELENSEKIQKTGVPSIQALNKNNFTPIQVSIACENHECFEFLAKDTNAKLNVKSATGNSAYHICAEFGNSLALKHLLEHYYSKNPNYLVTKNRGENTVMHLAASCGNLEIITLIYETLQNSSTLDKFLYTKNINGEIFFHLACLNGHLSVIEFFISNLKMLNLLTQVDNNFNTPLHLATYNGHSSLVNILLDYTTNLTSRNDDNLTTFELSCRQGFSQISKNMISREEIFDGEYPLHVACYEGAIEIVEVLLKRGVDISLLNNDNKNCMDICIERGEEGIIKLLLNDPNWKTLFRRDNSNPKGNYQNHVLIENPQFLALYGAKMWGIFEIILDKCIVADEDIVDFSILDRPYKSNLNHPLTFIARSGQENIIKHDACLLLLKLKWRIVPRLLYYSNLMMATLFLALMFMFTFDIQSNIDCTSSCNYNQNLSIAILVFNGINLAKFVIEFILTDKTAFFFSAENWLELSAYVTTACALNTNDLRTRISLGSWAVLSTFITYPLYLQKVRVFGVYVVAVVKTLKNSAKFFPIFLIILTGFVLSFYMRYNYGMGLGNPVSNRYEYAFIKSIAMSVGDISAAQDFDLVRSADVMNYVILFLFMIIINVVIYNLFVGIAVSDINSVLSEADVRFLSLRIIFSLQIQSVIDPFCKRSEFLSEKIGMNFCEFNQESKTVQEMQKRKNKIFKFLTTGSETINLADPQKRLEEMLKKMVKSSDNDTEALEKILKSRLEDLEFKLSESNRLIYANLIELSKNSDGSFNLLSEGLSKTNQHFVDNFSRIEGKMGGMGALPTENVQHVEKKNKLEEKDNFMLMNNLNEKFATVETKIENMNQQFESEIMDLKSQMNFFIKSLDKCLQDQTDEIQNALFLSESSIRSDLNETVKVIGKGFNHTKDSVGKLHHKVENLSTDLSKSKYKPDTIDHQFSNPISMTSGSFIDIEKVSSAGSSKNLITKVGPAPNVRDMKKKK